MAIRWRMVSRLRLQSREYRTDNPADLARQLKGRDTEVENQFRAPVEPLAVIDGSTAEVVVFGAALLIPRDGRSVRVPAANPDSSGRTFGVIVRNGSGSLTLAGGASGQIDGADTQVISSNGLRWYMSDGRGGWWRL